MAPMADPTADRRSCKKTCWKIILDSSLFVAASMIIAVCVTNIALKAGSTCKENAAIAASVEEDADYISLAAHKALMDRKIKTTVDRVQGGQTYYGTPPLMKNVTYLGFGSEDIGSPRETISTEFPKKIITDYIRRNFSSADPNEPLEHQFMCTWQIGKLLKRDVPVYKYRYLRQDFIQTGGGDSSSNFSCTVTIPSLSVWEHHGLLVASVHPWGTMRVVLHRAVFNISLPHGPGKPSLEADQPEERIENGVKVYEAGKGSNFRCIVNDTFPGFPEPEVTWWTQDEDGGDDKPGRSESSVGTELNFIGSLFGWVWCEASNGHGASRSDLIKIVEAPKGFREFP